MFTKDELAYLLALVDAESAFDEESRHLSEECSTERDDVRDKLERAYHNIRGTKP
jgi:hypothetical protein